MAGPRNSGPFGSFWWRKPIGKALRSLHAWNAWTVLLLAVTGIMLYLPALRGERMGISLRPAIKLLHDGLGVLSVILLMLYIPFIRRHMKQIRDRTSRQLNLGLVLFLLAGWAVSGFVLLAVRSISPGWASAALLAHDLLTWIGLPWAAYHSISRSRMVKRSGRGAGAGAYLHEGTGTSEAPEGVKTPQPAVQEAALHKQYDPPFYTRREFIRGAIGIGLAAAVGPFFWRWLRWNSGTMGGSLPSSALGAEDANRMLPLPAALPPSDPPIGGGAKGNFRIYTVTDMPVFTSEDWSLEVNGLVDRPMRFNWTEFLELQRDVEVVDFHCVTGWSVTRCTWEGIPLTRLFELASVRKEARFIKLYSGDGVYTDSLTLEQAGARGVMAAMLLDGKLLPQKLGGPVRLIVPDMYAYKSVKWLNRIELTDRDHTGYWEARGYDKNAWVPGKRPQA